jgi:hypothetical protein
VVPRGTIYHVQPTGLDLKLERVARRVKARAIAEAMGVHPSRISTIEAEHYPSPETVVRYREALATCATSPTSVPVELEPA